VATGTIRKVIMGEIIFSPCLKDVEEKEGLVRTHIGEKSPV
jgi:hypothetical protein